MRFDANGLLEWHRIYKKNDKRIKDKNERHDGLSEGIVDKLSCLQCF